MLTAALLKLLSSIYVGAGHAVVTTLPCYFQSFILFMHHLQIYINSVLFYAMEFDIIPYFVYMYLCRDLFSYKIFNDWGYYVVTISN